MSNTEEEHSCFPAGQFRRASKVLQRASQVSSEAGYKVIRRTSTSAKEIDSGLDEIVLTGNRFKARRRSTLPKVEKSTTILSYVYDIRKKLQKVEFLIIWVLICVLITSLAVADQKSFVDIYTISILYIQYSVLSRIFAYVMDFANASVKLGTEDNKWNGIPLWLILHHGGVLGSHIMIAFFFMNPAVDFKKMLLSLFATQSSHNTWTKKFSLILYWGNVVLGFLSLSYIAVLSTKRAVDDKGFSTAILLCSVISTLVGVLLLVIEAAKESKHESVSIPINKSFQDKVNSDSDTSDDDSLTEEEEMMINKISAIFDEAR